MNIKTKLFEEYVNFVDNTKEQNKNLWICTIILVFILNILTIIQVFIHSKKLCDSTITRVVILKYTYNCTSMYFKIFLILFVVIFCLFFFIYINI